MPLPVSERGKKRFWNRQEVEEWLAEPKDRYQERNDSNDKHE